MKAPPIRIYPVVLDVDGVHVLCETFAHDAAEATASALEFANGPYGFTTKKRDCVLIEVRAGWDASAVVLHRCSSVVS